MRLVADEGFNFDIVRGLRRRRPAIDIVRVQDVGLTGADDPVILAWAATEARVLLTHDAATMARYAYERIARGEFMPGVLEINQQSSVKDVIEDVLLIAECSLVSEWDDRIAYLPLR